MFFSGDTGLTSEYATIRERLGPFDLVMLRGRRVPPRRWATSTSARQMRSRPLDLLGGGAFLPVHWGTFSLALHAWDEPAETLLSLGTKDNARLVMPRLGESRRAGGPSA